MIVDRFARWEHHIAVGQYVIEDLDAGEYALHVGGYEASPSASLAIPCSMLTFRLRRFPSACSKTKRRLSELT